MADIVWPADEDRRQALVLLLVPLVLPALVNLVVPYRLTPDWTFPNWALLPVVLYASRDLIVDEAAVARAGLVALAGTVVALVASPVIACRQAHERPRPVSAAFSASRGTRRISLAGKPVGLFWGSPAVTAGLPFYLPLARPISADPSSAAGRAASGKHGLLVVCLVGDAPCQNTSDALAKAGARTTTVGLTRSFLGFSSPPLNFQITVVPPDSTHDCRDIRRAAGFRSTPPSPPGTITKATVSPYAFCSRRSWLPGPRSDTIAYSATVLHDDLLEVFVWSQHPAAGYSKQPPLAGLIATGWFTIFPPADWSFELLAMANSAIALFAVYLIARRYLNGDKRLLALLPLLLTPFYQFHSQRFSTEPDAAVDLADRDLLLSARI